MKKILFFVLALAICITPVIATEGQTEEQTISEIQAIETVSTITSIASVSGIGVLLVSIIIFIIKKIGWVKKSLGTILNALSSIFGKDNKIENMPLAIESVKASFNELKTEFEKVLAEEQARFDNLKAEYEAQHKENSEYKQAFALLCIYANNINPFVKNEIYRLIKGEIPFCGTIEETAQKIEQSAKAVQEAEPKVETPFLDIITKE